MKAIETMNSKYLLKNEDCGSWRYTGLNCLSTMADNESTSQIELIDRIDWIDWNGRLADWAGAKYFGQLGKNDQQKAKTKKLPYRYAH